MRRGVIIGRFQPFHFGHLSLVTQVLQDCNELIIVIGNSETNYTLKNPFTTGERIWMIRNSLLEHQIDLSKIYLIPITHDENNARWFGYLKSMLPPFDFVYTGNNFIKLLNLNESINIKNPFFSKKEIFNGSYIRRLIVNDDENWIELVPKSVYEIFKKINGEERLKLISSSLHDSPSTDRIIET